MMWTVLYMVLCATGVLSQPDTTPCDNNGVYNTDTGTASCGGFQVSVKALVCGDGFSQGHCHACWTNGGGEHECYFFMGAGAGIGPSVLPAYCSALPTGLAMVQYYPDKQSCYPAADLHGTTIFYTAGSSGTTPDSITLNFVEHNDGTVTRDGYMKITCNATVTSPSFTTVGDSIMASYYEVDTKAPCQPPPTHPPTQAPTHSPRYLCPATANSSAVVGGMGGCVLVPEGQGALFPGGKAECDAGCSPETNQTRYICQHGRCLPRDSTQTPPGAYDIDTCKAVCAPVTPVTPVTPSSDKLAPVAETAGVAAAFVLAVLVPFLAIAGWRVWRRLPSSAGYNPVSTKHVVNGNPGASNGELYGDQYGA